MRRLLKISFDQALLSLTPILSWFCLSLLIDKNLISVFTITYPLQYICGIIRSPFSIGANISKNRDKNKNAVMSGLVLGSIIAMLVYGFTILHIDSFINFMNMDASVYHTFAIYAVIILALQTIFTFVLDKLYYENQNNRANRYSIIFSLLNFSILIGTALLVRDPITIVTVTSIIMSVFTLYVFLRNCNRFRFRLNFLHCLKYDSSSLASYFFGFLTFLFGLSNALEFGAEYGLAITFVSLITDTQWDALESVTILAKVNVSQKKFNCKKSLRNAYALLSILYISSLVMFFGLCQFYPLNLPLTLVFLGFEFLDFLLCPAYYLYTSFLQLNWSATNTTVNRIIARSLRLCCSFLPTPFCNCIGSITSTLYQLATTKFFFYRNFLVDKNGRVSRRRGHRQPSLRYHYSDLPVDKD